MRTAVVVLLLLAGLALVPGAAGTGSGLASGSIIGAAQPAVSAQEAPKDVNVDINVNRGTGGRWYISPVWMAIGGLAILFVLVLIVAALRGGGGGTTIVHD